MQPIAVLRLMTGHLCQTLIKQIGEAEGYRATIERQTEDGSIDVALENDVLRIACEISVTTESTYEVGNIKRRLVSGFDYAAIVAAEKKQLSALKRALAEGLSPSEQRRVRVLEVQNLPDFLSELDAASAGREQRIGGYKVKTSFTTLSPDEKEARKRSLGAVVRDAMKRMGRKDK